MKKTRFEKIKVNDILVQYHKDRKKLIIYRVFDIDEEGDVYAPIIFTLGYYSTLSYFNEEEINNPSNKIYLLSELSEEDVEEIKNLVFNKILEIK
jgi:hypothetical protein